MINQRDASTYTDAPTSDVPSAKNAARRDFASFVIAQSSIPSFKKMKNVQLHMIVKNYEVPRQKKKKL